MAEEIEEVRRRVAQLSDQVALARQEQVALARASTDQVDLARLLGEEERLQRELETIKASTATQQENTSEVLGQFEPEPAVGADAPPLGTIEPSEQVASSAVAGTVTADRLAGAEATPSGLTPTSTTPTPTPPPPSPSPFTREEQ